MNQTKPFRRLLQDDFNRGNLIDSLDVIKVSSIMEIHSREKKMWSILSKQVFLNNELWRLLVFFASVLMFLIMGRMLRYYMEKKGGHVEGEDSEWSRVLFRALARPVVLIAVAAGLWLGMAILVVGEGLKLILETVTRVVNTAAIGYAVYRLVDLLDYYLLKLSKRTDSKVDDMLMPLVGKSVRITILILVLLQIVQALSDKPIMSILAGLGVGGLAIALAGQDTIKNFFGSLVIVADKPFEIGDRIVMDGHDGPVEYVGFRSTKIRTLDGHLVTVPNAEIVNKTVHNIGKRPYIRRVSNITITYETPPDKVERAVAILKELLDNHEGMNPAFPPRVFFSDFNDCSLNILMIYWYHPPDYWAYMEFTQRLNMSILRRFNEEGIDFAFPTQTIYYANADKQQLALQMLQDE
ncbi:MAG: mechanosensitive ion channel family protein [Lentisphaerae bacterium]|nr:mechanosensitive ion channel family protein [Lentisphaerota bacterium]